LPSLRPREVVKVLKRIGFEEIRQTGSHLILSNKITKRTIPIPIHNKNIKRGLLAIIIKQAGLKINEFLKLL
jgi:predicted RNA binding protein YcfA (HicA-like mRNA interferase family)